MDYYSFYLAFVLGLVSTAHCMWMCGGIIGALTLSVEKEVHNSKQSLFTYLLAIIQDELLVMLWQEHLLL
jgi:sulfite exporter TauE/SafE